MIGSPRRRVRCRDQCVLDFACARRQRPPRRRARSGSDRLRVTAMIKVIRSPVIGLWSAAVSAIAVATALVLHQTGQIDTASLVLIAGFSASAFAIAWIAAQHNAHRAELASQNQRFKDAFENLGQGLTMYDHDNKLVICNSRYHEIYGLDPEIVRPGIDLRTIATLLHADKLQDVDFDK